MSGKISMLKRLRGQKRKGEKEEKAKSSKRKGEKESSL